MNNGEKGWMDIKFGFMPLPVFVAGWLTLLVAHFSKAITANLFTGAFICALFGCGLRFVVDNVPVIKKTLGGAFVSLAGSVFVFLNWVPKTWIDASKLFINGKIDFLTCFVLTIICGTIITMNRRNLIRAGIRYFLPVIGGLLFAYGSAAIVGQFIGIGWKNAIMYIAGPIMGGGNGAGAVPMSEMYATALGQEQGEVYSQIHAMLSLGNWLSIFYAAFLNYVGNKFPSTTGNGILMEGLEQEEGAADYNFKFAMNDLLVGGCFVTMVFLLGRVASKFMPVIHSYAFAIIIVVICKIFNLIPRKIEYCCYKIYQLVGQSCMIILMGGLGIAMFNFRTLLESLNPQNLLICGVTVTGGLVGAWIFGKLVGFYPVESAITAGLCMSNAGGNGDIYVLTAADRMELMPFAQISSRIGGALVLVIQSFLTTLLLK